MYKRQEQAYEWKSSGADGYTVTECDKETVGTEVIMHIKPDTDEENYSEYPVSYTHLRLKLNFVAWREE